MFGLKLKSWMEAHLGRAQRQKSSSSTSSASTISGIQPSPSTCSPSSLQERTEAPKDISGSCGSGGGSTSNSSTSSSNASTSTTLGVAASSLFSSVSAPSNLKSNPTATSGNLQTLTSNLPQTTPPTTPLVTVKPGSTAQQDHKVEIAKRESFAHSITTTTSQHKDATARPNDSGIGLHSLGLDKSDSVQQSVQQQHRTTSIVPANDNVNDNRVSTVSTSVSNSTSILSGGSSSFCNNLSSPDTGYSTDGFSPTAEPQSVNKHSSASYSTASKSSCTISSLVASELLHSTHRTPSQTYASLVENAPSPSTVRLTSSQDNTKIESDAGSGAAYHSNLKEDVTASFSSLDKQVIMRVDGENEREPDHKNIPAVQQRLAPFETASVKGLVELNHSKFSPFDTDVLKRSCTSSGSSNHNNDTESVPRPGRTHRRAESMDACTPSHEDYKPLVSEEEYEHRGNYSSDLMTTVSSASAARSIRTSFELCNSGQLVEFISYKNAFSLCSPRARERTRIKTNPWITLSNNKKDESSSISDHTNSKSVHANPDVGSSGIVKVREIDPEKLSGAEGSCGRKTIPLEKAEGVDCEKIDPGSKRVNLLEINTRNEEEQQDEVTSNFMEYETGIVDQDSDDRSSSAQILYRISSVSDSGKGSLVDPETNRNSTESSCLLSEDSTRNSIISQEVSGSSCCGRSSSGDSISQHRPHHHHHQPETEDTLGYISFCAIAAKASSKVEHDHKGQRHSLQNKKGIEDHRTFRNASVATTDLLVKSASVSIGVGTTGSNKSASKQPPIMVDKETDILSDWATNTDVEDTEDDLETDREGGNNEDNETVTPAPSSPGSDAGKAFYSQSSSATTDVDFGDSSAATASSTQVLPPSSLLRQNNHDNSNINACPKGNGGCYHNTSANNRQSESCEEEYQYCRYQSRHLDHNQCNLTNMTPSVVPIVRPVLAAAQQHYNQDMFSFSAVGHQHQTLHTQPHAFQPVLYPHSRMEDDLSEDAYPQIKPSGGHKGLARGALGFLRKIFKKGACSSQRHSPESIASSAAGKRSKVRGTSDNNLATIGRGSPLLTISEPLSNPRYSAAVLTTKKHINPLLNGCYFLTPTPNSFRRRSGATGGAYFGGQSDSNNSGSDSRGSSTSKQPSKCVKTDIIRLPQGPLSPHQSVIQIHHQTSSSHSTGSSSSCSILGSLDNSGIIQHCPTFLPHGAPIVSPLFFPIETSACNNGTGQQSTAASNANNSSPSSSAHSLTPTSTCQSSNQSQCKISNRINQNINVNSSSGLENQIPTNTTNMPFSMPINSNNLNENSSPFPPVISESSPCVNRTGRVGQNRRDLPPLQPQQSVKGIMPPYEYAPRLLTNCTSTAAARMNSPNLNASYSPIHRLVGTTGASSNNNPSTESGHCPSGPSLVPIPRYNTSRLGADNNCNKNFGAQVINRSHSHNPYPGTSMSQSPLIDPRAPPSHPLISSSSSRILVASSPASSQQQQPTHNFYATPSPILRNPRYQYITSSNQNSPILNSTKRFDSSRAPNMPCSSTNKGRGSHGGPPSHLTTFTPVSSYSSGTSCTQRGTPPVGNNGNGNADKILINPSSLSSVVCGKQVVATSLSYNEFETLNREQENLYKNNNVNNSTNFASINSAPPPKKCLYYTRHCNNENLHAHPNHYYSSPIGKTMGEGELKQYRNLQHQKTASQNMRFTNFLVRHRQLPQFYHTQWGLQERIYESVDSEEECSSRDRGSVGESGEIRGSADCEQHFSKTVLSQSQQNQDTNHSMKQSYSFRDGGVFFESNHVDNEDAFTVKGERSITKRIKPKSLSRAFPRAVVALPMMPAGTFLSETETRLLEVDKECDRKYKRLINEAEALLKEISVEKEKRASAAVNSVRQHDNNSFKLEDCPQSDPLRRKAYDCWALRRLQQELAGCCASPPVLHRSRLNLQSPSTPTLTNDPYLSHFQSAGLSTLPPALPLQVPYTSSANAAVEPNHKSFEF